MESRRLTRRQVQHLGADPTTEGTYTPFHSISTGMHGYISQLLGHGDSRTLGNICWFAPTFVLALCSVVSHVRIAQLVV